MERIIDVLSPLWETSLGRIGLVFILIVLAVKVVGPLFKMALIVTIILFLCLIFTQVQI